MQNVVICLRPPPLLGYCFGWSSNFVGSESGVKLPQNTVWSPTGLDPPPPQSLTVCTVFTYFDTGRGGGGEESKREG
jgi:hypothetical protein